MNDRDQEENDEEYLARRREERREERRTERKSFRWGLAWYAIGMFVVGFVYMTPMKIIDWSNCEDVCEANGHECMWKISQGCFCKDDDGVYNPRDER